MVALGRDDRTGLAGGLGESGGGGEGESRSDKRSYKTHLILPSPLFVMLNVVSIHFAASTIGLCREMDPETS
jgi:hypothetical protein